MCVIDLLDAVSTALANLLRAAIEERDALAIGQALAAMKALGLDDTAVAAYLAG